MTSMRSLPLLSQPLVQVRQRTKLFELRNQYELLDAEGAPIGAVEQVRQSPLAVLARVFSDLDVALPVELEVREPVGVALTLRKSWFSMTVEVRDAAGVSVGSIRKQIRMGKARFTMMDGSGRPCGEVRAQNWRAKDFTVLDDTGRDVARVTKRWAGFAREMFTDADHYAIELPSELTGPLRALSFAAPFAIDLVMKQKDAN